MYRVILGIMYRRNLQLKDAFTSFVAAVQCTDVEVEKDALPTSVVDVYNVLYCIALASTLSWMWTHQHQVSCL
jgi:hypothetical protein